LNKEPIPASTNRILYSEQATTLVFGNMPKIFFLLLTTPHGGKAQFAHATASKVAQVAQVDESAPGNH